MTKVNIWRNGNKASGLINIQFNLFSCSQMDLFFTNMFKRKLSAIPCYTEDFKFSQNKLNFSHFIK